MPFTGDMTIKVLEAADLKPTEFSVRHKFDAVVGRSSQQMIIDPYVYIVVDDNFR